MQLEEDWNHITMGFMLHALMLSFHAKSIPKAVAAVIVW